MRVLLIEDDPGFRALIERILNKAGHTMCWSGTGHGGIRAMYAESPDLILLDMNLGTSMSGWDVARIRYFDPTLRHIPLVIISGVPPQELKEQAHVNVLSDALIYTKPISQEELNEMFDLLARNVGSDPV